VTTEDLLVDYGGYWQTIEAICKCLPKFDVVASFAFIIETVYAIDTCAFVIAAQQEEIVKKRAFIATS